jgi:hypothetical protein
MVIGEPVAKPATRAGLFVLIQQLNNCGNGGDAGD